MIPFIIERKAILSTSNSLDKFYEFNNPEYIVKYKENSVIPIDTKDAYVYLGKDGLGKLDIPVIDMKNGKRSREIFTVYTKGDKNFTQMLNDGNLNSAEFRNIIKLSTKSKYVEGGEFVLNPSYEDNKFKSKAFDSKNKSEGLFKRGKKAFLDIYNSPGEEASVTYLTFEKDNSHSNIRLKETNHYVPIKVITNNEKKGFTPTNIMRNKGK